MSLFGSGVHLAGNAISGFGSFLAVLPTVDHQTPSDFAKLWTEEGGIFGAGHSTTRKTPLVAVAH